MPLFTNWLLYIYIFKSHTLFRENRKFERGKELGDRSVRAKGKGDGIGSGALPLEAIEGGGRGGCVDGATIFTNIILLQQIIRKRKDKE